MNEVSLIGKVSRVGRLRYLPSGQGTLDFTVAVTQAVLDKPSVGYFEAVLFGTEAEEAARRIKIGVNLSLKGQLWGRSFRSRQGTRVNETKVLVSSWNLESLRGGLT